MESELRTTGREATWAEWTRPSMRARWKWKSPTRSPGNTGTCYRWVHTTQGIIRMKTNWGWVWPSSVQDWLARKADFIFLCGPLLVMFSSCMVVFLWGLLPLKSPSTEVFILWGQLPVRLPYFESITLLWRKGGGQIWLSLTNEPYYY